MRFSLVTQLESSVLTSSYLTNANRTLVIILLTFYINISSSNVYFFLSSKCRLKSHPRFILESSFKIQYILNNVFNTIIISDLTVPIHVFTMSVRSWFTIFVRVQRCFVLYKQTAGTRTANHTSW